jgi:hypothetical protein
MKWRTAFATFSVIGSAALATENLVIPVDVNELINARGCSQVSDFYIRPAVEHPPYALAEGENGKRQLAVWCTTNDAEPAATLSYTLILQFDDPKHPLAQCPNHISGISNIGGLQFVEITEPAAWYYFIETTKPIAATGTLQAKAISSIYDGSGNYFVCVNGQWATRAVH